MRVVILSVGALLLAAAPAGAVGDYDACLGLIEQDPARAVREAGDWVRYDNGGAEARHCYALALLATGAPLSAADELMALASEEPGLSDLDRSNMMVQAGEILLDAGEDLSPAIIAAQALQIAPANPAALVFRAAVRLQGEDIAGALADLDAALAQGGETADLLTLRAAARRRAGSATAARDDAIWATELDPEAPRAWLERGRAEAAVRDRHAARQSFLRVMELARGTELARAAQLALQRMDSGAGE